MKEKEGLEQFRKDAQKLADHSIDPPPPPPPLNDASTAGRKRAQRDTQKDILSNAIVFKKSKTTKDTLPVKKPPSPVKKTVPAKKALIADYGSSSDSD